MHLHHRVSAVHIRYWSSLRCAVHSSLHLLNNHLTRSTRDDDDGDDDDDDGDDMVVLLAD